VIDRAPARLGRRSAAASLAVALAVLGVGLGARAAAGASFDDLVANLKSPNAKTRREAAEALGKSRRREAVAPLAALVRDPDGKVRLTVVRSLRELRDVAAVPALVTSLEDGDARIRAEAIESLVDVYVAAGSPASRGQFLDFYDDEEDDRLAPAPYAAVDPAVYRGLTGTLRDEDEKIRENAALALGILGGTSAVRELVALLQDPEADVRAAAVMALSKVGDEEAGRALVPVLADESTEVRRRALQAIGELKVKAAGPALREIYQGGRSKDMALRALKALSRIEDPAQADLFREVVLESDSEKRRLAIEGLGRIADASMLPAFKKDFQREGNEELKLAYAFAIARLGDHAFLDTIVLKLPSGLLGPRCRSYLLELGTSILPDLYPYLNDPVEAIRAGLCDVLGALGDPDAIPHVAPLVNDPSPDVADHANRAVERLRRAKATAP
jgi:HEAT repeat protein